MCNHAWKDARVDKSHSCELSFYAIEFQMTYYVIIITYMEDPTKY